MKIEWIAASLALLLVAGPAAAEQCPALLQHELPQLRSKETIDLCEQFQGKALVVVNTASFYGWNQRRDRQPFASPQLCHKDEKPSGRARTPTRPRGPNWK